MQAARPKSPERLGAKIRGKFRRPLFRDQLGKPGKDGIP